MSTMAEEMQIKRISFTDSRVHIYLQNKLVITVPFENFPALRGASREALAKWEISADGIGVHWAELDAELSLPEILGLLSQKEKSKDPLSSYHRGHWHRTGG